MLGLSFGNSMGFCVNARDLMSFRRVAKFKMRATNRLILQPLVWCFANALSVMPTAAATGLSERLMGNRAFDRLSAAGFGALAERLLLHRLAEPPAGAEFEGVILIAGPPRIGKSTVARAVAESLAMRVLSTDQIAKSCSLGKNGEGEASLRDLLMQICEQSRGLVLEGRHLVEVAKSGPETESSRFAFDCSRLRNRMIHGFAFGCCESSVEAWDSALREHGGWIKKKGVDYIQGYARTRSARSRQIRDFARDNGLEYFEIPREDFAKSIDHAVAAIVARVRA